MHLSLLSLTAISAFPVFGNISQIEQVKISLSYLTYNNCNYFLQEETVIVKWIIGPLSSNIVSGSAFFSSSLAPFDWPDLQLHHVGLGIRHGGSEDLTLCFGLKPSVLFEYLAPYTKLDANFVLLDLGRPKSTGFVELKSKDPFVPPKIDPRYFSHPHDMKAMVDGTVLG